MIDISRPEAHGQGVYRIMSHITRPPRQVMVKFVNFNCNFAVHMK